MVNTASAASNNQPYYRPVSSTKNAVGTMMSSREQNNGFKSSQ